MTANRATLLALASRVEAATGADSECVIREASWAVNVMLANRQDLHNRVNVLLSVEAYESAAMSLVPSEAYWRLGHDGDGADPAEYKADVIVPKLGGVDARGRAIAATPPLALTAAACRAIAGSMTDD